MLLRVVCLEGELNKFTAVHQTYVDLVGVRFLIAVHEDVIDRSIGLINVRVLGGARVTS